MNHLLRYFQIVSLLLCLITFSCNSAAIQKQIATVTPKQKKQPQAVTVGSAEKFIEVHLLGQNIILNDKFDEFLSKITKKSKSNRVYLARIDDFPIGTGYKSLDKWDMALESGLIDGLIDKDLNIVEKLDHVKPRDFDEYIDTSPEDAFYMHGIDLDALKLIKNKIQASNLLTYQIIDFSENELSAVIYFRMIDLKNMKIIGSSLVEVGDNFSAAAKEEIKIYNHVVQVLEKINDFPNVIFNKGSSIGLLNSDILNVSGTYNNPPSKKLMAIENGIVTGLINNSDYKENEPVILEKSKGFKLKYPSVYNNIVFNTNPLLYEDWNELILETGCSFLLMYRYINDYGLYLKVVDTKQNGKILFSETYSFKGQKDEGIIKNYEYVSSSLQENIKLNLIKEKKTLILNGDKQTVESENYFDNQPLFNEMNLAIEEGIISGLLNNDISVFEKLKTLYLKRPWMYKEKIFKLNPLYLDQWKQLEEFGVESLIVYTNLIEYEKLNANEPDYKKVALGIRIIDVSTGDIIDVGKISNFKNSSENLNVEIGDIEEGVQ